MFKKLLLVLVVGFSVFLFNQTWAVDTEGLMFNFCDISNDDMLNLVATPGEQIPICLKLENSSNDPIPMQVYVNNGAPNTSFPGRVVCTALGDFSQFVSDIKGVYDVPANGELEVRGTMSFPIEAAGEQLGCIAISKVIEGGGAAGISRVARGIKVFVDTNISVGLQTIFPSKFEGQKNISSNRKVFVGKQDEKYISALGLLNTGSITQNVKASVSMSDILGKSLLSVSDIATKVSPGMNDTIEIELPKIPWYKMSYTLKYTIVHQATTTVESEFITPDMLAEQTFTETATFFLFPWWLVAVLLALIILWKIAGHMAKKSRERKHELEELRHYVHDHDGQQQQQ